MTPERTPQGRFAPGTSGNRAGRPAKKERQRAAAAANLAELGFTSDQVNAMLAASANQTRALASVTAMAAAVVAIIDKPRPLRRRRSRKDAP